MILKIKKLSTLKELKDGYEIFRHCMYQPTEEKYRKKMTEWMEEKNIIVYAAMEENRIKGMIVFRFCQDNTAEVMGVAVHTAYRLQGIGSELIRQVAKEYGIEKIVAETDEQAVLFYRKTGFQTEKNRTKIFRRNGRSLYLYMGCNRRETEKRGGFYIKSSPLFSA